MCPKVACRGDQWSPADFAPEKSVAVRRKYGYFPSGNPKNVVFRRAINDRPYNLNRRKRFFDSLTPPRKNPGRRKGEAYLPKVRYRKVTTWARLQGEVEPNSVADIPSVMPFSRAQRMAGSYQEPAGTSWKG